MTIVVCPLSNLANMVEVHRPARVISILDPSYESPNLGQEFDGRHLRLTFHDVHDPADGAVVPAVRHVEELVVFLSAWDVDGSLLVHCRAGIGRSTAAAFIAACWYNPEISEVQIARALRRNGPLARPNEALVQIADQVMGRDGRMTEAIVASGRGLPWPQVDEGEPFEFPLFYSEQTR